MTTLLERFREGDSEAASEFAEAFAAPALTAACAILERPADGETAAALGLLAALRDASRFQPATDDEARFVLARVRLEAMLILREGRRRRRRRHDRGDEEIETALSGTLRLPAPEAAAAAFADLRPPLREALSVAWLNGLDVPELSRRLNTSESAARARLRAGLVELLDVFAEPAEVAL